MRYAVTFALAVLSAGCGGARGTIDASRPQSEHTASLIVRVELAASGPITAGAIAFRSASARIPAGSVAGLVDPLSSPGPAAGQGCLLRDADAAVRGVGTAGGSLELDELPGLEIEVASAPATFLRPSARLYPEIGAMGGVVSESAPVEIPAVPATLAVSSSEPGHFVLDLPVPEPARIVAIGGVGPPLPAATSLASDMEIEVSSPGAVEIDVAGGVAAAAETVVEIRPFGGTAAVACAPGAGGRIVVPRASLVRAGARPGSILSVDAVRRGSHPVHLGGQPVRAVVEVRAGVPLELRP